MMLISVFAMFSIFLLLAIFAAAVLMTIFSPRRWLVGIGMLLACLLLIGIVSVIVPVTAMRSVHHVAPRMTGVRWADVEQIRMEAEAVARRHAEQAHRAIEEANRSAEFLGGPAGPPMPPLPPAHPEREAAPVQGGDDGQATGTTAATAVQPTEAPPVAKQPTDEVAEQPTEPAAVDPVAAAAVLPTTESVMPAEPAEQSEGDRAETPESTAAATGEITGPADLHMLTEAAELAIARSVEASGRPLAVDTAVPLAVAPDSITSDAARPAWVEQPPTQVDGHMAMVLVSDPYEDRFACDEDLERRTRDVLLQAARHRCRQRGLPTDLPIEVTFEEIGMVSQQRHYQRRETSLGDMVQAYQLTVLNDAFQAKLDRRIDYATVDQRLVATGLFSGGVLAVISLLFGALRFAARKAPDPLSA
jgi:hypothetical protein